MELTCEKYKEKLKEGEAICGHLEEYCKFRESCIINFMTRERDREERQSSHIADADQTKAETVKE